MGLGPYTKNLENVFSWEVLLTGRIVINDVGLLTVTTTVPVFDARGVKAGEDERILPRPTMWMGC